jgi:hypothetical protein
MGHPAKTTERSRPVEGFTNVVIIIFYVWEQQSELLVGVESESESESLSKAPELLSESKVLVLLEGEMVFR